MNAHKTEDILIVSWYVFGIWWLVFLAVHLVTCCYNAAFAIIYWRLEETMLCRYLVFYHVGMPPDNYATIAVAHMMVSTVHGLCIVSMIGSSLWFRTLTFTPWGGSSTVREGARTASDLSRRSSTGSRSSSRVNSALRTSVTKLTLSLTNRYGLLGVNGQYFHVLLISRELVETTLQTIQAYRMSFLLPSMLLNRFYVVGLILNCWSSAIIHVLPFRGNEARKRFASLACDCALDLMSCMGVTGIVVLSYVSQYDPKITDFGINPWYNDVWAARALNEFQMVAVVSWSDLVSRVIFSLGLLVTTTNLKELLYRSSWGDSRVAVSNSTLIVTKKVKVKQITGGIGVQPSKPMQGGISGKVKGLVPGSSGNAFAEGRWSQVCLTMWVRRIAHAVLHGVHMVFFIWGLLVLGFHIQASISASLPQCTLQVRPWAVSRPSCFLVCLDCNHLGISGGLDEIDENWREFDGSTVVMMLIKHCPLLDVPDIFKEFHRLISVKIYNTTIVDWRASAAITNTHHPAFLSLMMARVNMTDGLLPAGFLSSDTPLNLYDFEFCVTNLREVPDDLDTKWLLGSYVIIEYSQLQTVPASVMRIAPGYLSLIGNPISELPPDVFEIEGLTDLGIGFTQIHELPWNVTQLSSTLTSIYIPGTDISYFWPWTDDLFGRQSARWVSRPILAGGSTYCKDLEKIANGLADTFSAPSSTRYSVNLMDPAKANPGGLISSWVDCSISVSGISGPLYPLVAEDEHNAISL